MFFQKNLCISMTIMGIFLRNYGYITYDYVPLRITSNYG